MNCMEVFHYVSDQVKDLPLFEATSNLCHQNDGAIYNDFDNPAPFGDHIDHTLSFSSQNMDLLPASESSVRKADNSLVTTTEVEHAIMESDRMEGNWNEDLIFNTDSFIYGGEIDKEYMLNVYTLLTTEKSVLDELSERAVEIFNIRKRNNWAVGDTVYDAWLLRSGYERPHFDKQQFALEHPDLDLPVATSSEEPKVICKFSPVAECRKRRRISTSSEDSNSDGNTSNSSPSISSLLQRESDNESTEGGMSPSLATRSSQNVDKKPSSADLKRYVPKKCLTKEPESIDISDISENDDKADVWFQVSKFEAPKKVLEKIIISSDDE